MCVMLFVCPNVTWVIWKPTDHTGGMAQPARFDEGPHGLCERHNGTKLENAAPAFSRPAYGTRNVYDPVLAKHSSAIAYIGCKVGSCEKGMSEKGRKNMNATEEYLKNLRQWLQDTADSPLEEMSAFFTKRLDGYEEHMSVWKGSYEAFARLLPTDCREVLDLGCGTGLELDEIWKRNPDVAVTGVDLCRDMLDKLLEKHAGKKLTVVCRDYFEHDFGQDRWDAVISFESLHHFLPERKEKLYRKIRSSLKEGGTFLLGDYIACCDEEEALLRSVYLEKRKSSAIPDSQFVHFDVPLTLEHEKALLESAGLVVRETLDDPDGATILVAGKETSREPSK